MTYFVSKNPFCAVLVACEPGVRRKRGLGRSDQSTCKCKRVTVVVVVWLFTLQVCVSVCVCVCVCVYARLSAKAEPCDDYERVCIVKKKVIWVESVSV